MSNTGRNVIISGIPRSGTTLLTAMMDTAPDTVALNEPRWQYEWAHKNRNTSPPEDFARWLVGDFVVTRQKLLKGAPLPERRGEGGKPVTDYYRINDAGEMEDTFQTIPFRRAGLSPDFTLAMKHNGLYFGALQQIIEMNFFEIFVIVRHPVDVIASWNRAPIPLSEGKMPGAIVYWDQMNNITRAHGVEVLEKQVAMYDLLCERIEQFKEHLTIIRYEDLIEVPGSVCRVMGVPPEAAQLITRKPALVNDNAQSAIAKAVKKHGQFYTRYYTKL